MYFKTRYFRNPLDNATPYKSGKGEHLINRGLYNLKKKIKKPKLKINPKRNAKRVIHGFAYLYGFRYRCFLKDNFTPNYNRSTTQSWITLIVDLHRQLNTIHQYPNMSSLLRSRYHKYLMISHIEKYYHPRRKYVKDARKDLAKLTSNQRYWFTGRFVRFGRKPHGQLTILLTNIKHNRQLVTNHLWFNATKGFRELGHLDTNAKIVFKARVHQYKKGRLVKRHDFDLEYPSQIHLI